MALFVEFSEVIDLIASLGIPLEYFPEDDIWSYDDGEPCGLVVEVWTGTNGLGLPGCWVEVSNYLKENTLYSFSCSLYSWMADMSEPFKAKLAQLR